MAHRPQSGRPMTSRSILCFLLAVAPLIRAQNLSEDITINAVEVPVYVTGTTGAPVQGLTRDDFELFVNGKPQPIDYFDVVDETEVAAAPATPEAPRDLRRRRLSLLLFYPVNSTVVTIQSAKEKAQAFIDSAPAGDTFGVAVARPNRIEFVVPFTSDRVAVKRAVATLRASQSGDALNLATLDRERSAWAGSMVPDSDRQRFDSESAGEAEPAVEDSDSMWIASNRASFSMLQDAREDEAEVYAGQRFGETEKWMGMLGALAERLAPLEGVKHVVLLREGGVEVDFTYYSAITSTHAKFRKAGVILDAVGRERDDELDPVGSCDGDAEGIPGRCGIDERLRLLLCILDREHRRVHRIEEQKGESPAAEIAWRFGCRRRSRHYGFVDDVEVVDRLRLPVDEQLEVVPRQPLHGRAGGSGDVDRHLDGVDGDVLGKVLGVDR